MVGLTHPPKAHAGWHERIALVMIEAHRLSQRASWTVGLRLPSANNALSFGGFDCVLHVFSKNTRAFSNQHRPNWVLRPSVQAVIRRHDPPTISLAQ